MTASTRNLPTFTDVLRARRVLAAYLTPTPAFHYPVLDAAVGATVWVKHENCQPVGAFKVRGGLALLASLDAEQRANGVIAASTGNHAQSLAYAAREFGVPCTIVMPENPNPVKAAAVRALGATLVESGAVFDDACDHAAALAEKTGAHFVNSGDEPWLLAGVGTAALELFEAAPDLDALFVPVGAGTGAAGACITAAAMAPECRVYGVQSRQAPSAYESWRTGGLVDRPNTTTIEGLSTGHAFALPQEVMRRHLHDFLLLDDAEIRKAQRLLLTTAHTMAEGAGAAALAGLLSLREEFAGKKVGVICSGGNASEAELKTVLEA
jgi:threonine dehydratase